ncbi:MAG TPA: FAD-linked oxidase C-terminal domain-containing protein [Solirubrobacteraceae bacterium]|nr:FAD-linked oxidase C-terminal domain-containing protein [Solirubrobacteraceae bacterium]
MSTAPASGVASTASRAMDGLDARALARDLAREVRGEVRFSPGSRALYANDASVYRKVPIGVVVPRSAGDVVAAVEICRRHGASVGARGCGTGLAGQTVNEAVLFDFSKYMNEIRTLDVERRTARVQPGVVLDRLRDAAEVHGLTFGPDPATHSRCTLGGMIGNNSCGTHSILAGVTADNIEWLDVLLYDGTRMTLPRALSDLELQKTIDEGGRVGEIHRRLRDLRDRYADAIRERFPRIPRRISGYNLDRLLPEAGFNLAAAMVGTEATCALVLEAGCTLIHSPPHRSLVLAGYDDCASAADEVPWVMEFDPIGLETFDRRLLDNELKKGFKRNPALLPDGDAWLLVEFGADTETESDEQAERFVAAVKRRGGHHGIKLYEDEREIAQVWEIREGGVGNSKIPGEHPGWPSWEDAAVDPARIGDYLRDLERLCDRHGRRVSCLFGHIGHGCVHSRIDWDFLTPEGVRNYRAFMEDAGDLIASYGGSLSGEHGDGHARAELLPKMFGPELVQAFREFKAIWDPDGRMNPGKVSDPYPLDAYLRTGPDHRTREVHTKFAYAGDDGSFAAAAERCFGVGACRDQDGVMCPSYQVTREEKHSTRGRARLLFEMMRTDPPLQDGWREEEVKEALDLCLACKGCLHECPVRVDMATYKAEFLSHYYSGRVRPRQAYALGLIRWEAQLASHMPGLANLLTQREPFAAIGKRLAGIAPERTPPAFAPVPFHRWFAERWDGTRAGNGDGRGAANGTGANGAGRGAANGSMSADGARPRGPVLLFCDTFNDFFHPEVAVATADVLQAAGFEVRVPRRPLCCGRPLYDYGMLTLARRLLKRVLRGLREEIRAGIPVVVPEPSCGAVFRSELIEMLPRDEDAGRLARQTYTLGELLEREAADWEMPRLERPALVHFHCHQRATSDTDCDEAVLRRLGVAADVLSTGCCGLAGSFGYERGERYEVSVKAGEQALLPAVRGASPHTLIVTDGFSCRSQNEHGSDRIALHLSQVVQMALRDGPNGPIVPRPERAYAVPPTLPAVARSVSGSPGAPASERGARGGRVAWHARGRRTMSEDVTARPETRERLLALAVAAGSVDAISYLALAHAFPANMTGNTVLLALSLAHGPDAHTVPAAVSLAGFSLGVLAGAGTIDPRRRWPDGARPALAAHTLLLLAIALWWSLGGRPSAAAGDVMLGAAGLAMGLQSVAVLAAGAGGIATTYVTGTLTRALARLSDRFRGAAEDARTRRLRRLAELDWLLYGLGAFCGGLLALHAAADAFFLPAALTAVSLLRIQVRGRRGSSAGASR